MELTAQQLQSVRGGESLRLIDPETQLEFVVVRSDVYEQAQNQSREPAAFLISEAYPLMDAVARNEGWDDPSMDVYNDH